MYNRLTTRARSSPQVRWPPRSAADVGASLLARWPDSIVLPAVGRRERSRLALRVHRPPVWFHWHVPRVALHSLRRRRGARDGLSPPCMLPKRYAASCAMGAALVCCTSCAALHRLACADRAFITCRKPRGCKHVARLCAGPPELAEHGKGGFAAGSGIGSASPPRRARSARRMH